jgi:hypothetical protein
VIVRKRTVVVPESVLNSSKAREDANRFTAGAAGLAVVAGRSRQILAVAEVGWANNEAGDPLLNRATFHVSARVGLVRRSSNDPNRGATAGRYEYARPLAYHRATGTSPICWRARLLGKCRRREQKG